MRHLVLLLLASCGRLGFELAGDRVDAGTDVGGVDAATLVDCSTSSDGTPCDDRNVCTPTASCVAGACMAASPMATCTLADSADDFEVNAQGAGGWWYGFWVVGDPAYDPDTDFQLGMWGSDSYVPTDINGTYLYIAWWGTHPDDSPVVHTVRRWVSDVSGPAVVNVSMRKVDTTCGEGVDGRLVVDGVSVWSHTFAFDDNVGVAMPIAVTLEVGSRVELLVGALTNDDCDTTETTVTIAAP